MTTKEFMRKIRRKLTALEGSVSAECGYDSAVDRSIHLRNDLEELIETEHRALQSSLGREDGR